MSADVAVGRVKNSAAGGYLCHCRSPTVPYVAFKSSAAVLSTIIKAASNPGRPENDKRTERRERIELMITGCYSVCSFVFHEMF